MTSLNISLPKSLKEYAEEQAVAGGYTSVSEYLRELLRSDQRHQAEAKVEALLLEDLPSGPAAPITPEDWQAIRREALKRIESQKAA